MVTTRREFLKSTSVACLATAASTPLLNSKLAAQVSSPAPVSYTHLTLPTICSV